MCLNAIVRVSFASNVGPGICICICLEWEPAPTKLFFQEDLAMIFEFAAELSRIAVGTRHAVHRTACRRGALDVGIVVVGRVARCWR